MENIKEERNNNNTSPAIGPDKIDAAEREKQLESLMQLVEEKGIDHAEKVAKKLDDHYVLGRFYEEIGKIEKQKAEAENEKKNNKHQ